MRRLENEFSVGANEDKSEARSEEECTIRARAEGTGATFGLDSGRAVYIHRYDLDGSHAISDLKEIVCMSLFFVINRTRPMEIMAMYTFCPFPVHSPPEGGSLQAPHCP